jgi:hypothetical protein
MLYTHVFITSQDPRGQDLKINGFRSMEFRITEKKIIGHTRTY